MSGELRINTQATIERLSKRYSSSSEEFIKWGSTLALKEKIRSYKIERMEILARYAVTTVDELKTKIELWEVPEHPAWEDLIEIKNIEMEIKELENDMRALQEV